MFCKNIFTFTSIVLTIIPNMSNAFQYSNINDFSKRFTSDYDATRLFFCAKHIEFISIGENQYKITLAGDRLQCDPLSISKFSVSEKKAIETHLNEEIEPRLTDPKRIFRPCQGFGFIKDDLELELDTVFFLNRRIMQFSQLSIRDRRDDEHR